MALLTEAAAFGQRPKRVELIRGKPDLLFRPRSSRPALDCQQQLVPLPSQADFDPALPVDLGL